MFKSNELTSFTIGNKSFKLKKGDYLFINAWDKGKTYFNAEEYDEFPVIYKGITIESELDDVIENFNLKSGLVWRYLLKKMMVLQI